MTKNNNLRLLPVIIVGIVALVGIVVLVGDNNSNLQGATIYKEEVKEFQPTCIDNDPANDYNVKGTVRLTRFQYNDYCRDGRRVMQAYCASSNSVRQTKSHECLNGCQDGVCR